MSLDGRLKELADESAAAAVEKIWRLLHAQNLETEEAIRELSDRVARLEEAPVRTPRTRKDPA